MLMKGEIVWESRPYWKVVRREDDRCDVIDTRTIPAKKVHGPVSFSDAKAYAHTQMLIHQIGHN